MCKEKSDQSSETDNDSLQDSLPGNNFDDKSSIYEPRMCKPETNKNKNKRKGILAQCLVTGAVMLSSASCGMPVGYSAILLPKLKLVNDSMQIDDEMGSWIAGLISEVDHRIVRMLGYPNETKLQTSSMHSAATPLGSFLSGLFMDHFGRKIALQIASTPLIIGWFLICFAPNHTILLLGRMIAGISAGLTAAAGQVLIGEISEPHLRGMFSSVPFASYSFGILLVYALGSFLPWRYVAGLSTILPITALTVLFCLPESPLWLIRNGQIDEAKEALVWLRGGCKNKAKEETQHLIHRLETETINQEAHFFTLFQPEVLKPLIIINIFNTIQILSGTYLIVYYAVDILSHLHGTENLDHFLTAILTACVRFIFSIIASILLTLIGRRALALTSGIGTAISAMFIGTFLYIDNPCFDYIPAILIFVYVATNTLGFMILPGVMLGELFPAKIRGLASGLTFMLFNFMLFGVAKVFPLLKNSIGITGIFWVFGISSSVACVFLYLTLPETKCRTLSEIEDYFQQKGFLWINRKKRWQQSEQCSETQKLAV